MKEIREQFDTHDLEHTLESMDEIKDTILGIYNKYNHRLRGYLARHMGSYQDVDDMAQEVYLRLIQQHRRKDQKPSYALVRTIASNLLKDRYRREYARRMQAHVSADDVNLASPDVSPEQIVLSKEVSEMLAKVFESLNKNSQRAFLLHRSKGYTYKEIASEMGISKAMVQKHISHVLLKLDKKLGKHQ
ncbi:MAG: RNA polymerase sigma factor [Deltaproteobacteria bacterium]|nr:RNA polymerase sigma factor [Deltaproteobacteria bacterium]